MKLNTQIKQQTTPHTNILLFRYKAVYAEYIGTIGSLGLHTVMGLVNICLNLEIYFTKLLNQHFFYKMKFERLK